MLHVNYHMVGNISMELYLAVGEIKLTSPNFNPPTFFIVKKSRRLKLLEYILFFKHVLSMSFTRLKNTNHFTKDVSLPWQLIHFPLVALFPSAYASLVFDSSCLHCRSSPMNSVHMSLNTWCP